MGSIRPPKPVKLLVGLLSGDRDLISRACQLLSKRFGEIDLKSEYWPFEQTEYYSDELGEHIERHFVAFSQLIHPDAIAEIKRQTNDIETRICEDLALPVDRRPVNLDPGYVALSKLVLATTKDYSHRIYLRRGIYVEATLRFHDGAWRPWPWTYPDYASKTYREFFMTVREQLKKQYSEFDTDRRGTDSSG